MDCFEKTIKCPKYGFHATTPKKLQAYQISKRIFSPVRFWPNETTAKEWAKRVNRSVILKIELNEVSYPLPDHKPALFTPFDVLKWEQIK